jgi:hypothetical protein
MAFRARGLVLRAISVRFASGAFFTPLPISIALRIRASLDNVLIALGWLWAMHRLWHARLSAVLTALILDAF